MRRDALAVLGNESMNTDAFPVKSTLEQSNLKREIAERGKNGTSYHTCTRACLMAEPGKTRDQKPALCKQKGKSQRRGFPFFPLTLALEHTPNALPDPYTPNKPTTRYGTWHV